MKHISRIITLLFFGSMLTVVAISNTATAAGKGELFSSCEHCHGKAGVSKDHEIPIIGGLSSQYIIDSFTAYKDKTRPCEEVKYITGPDKGKTSDMCKITEKLSTDEIKQLADHFAAKPFVRARQKFDAGLAAKGKAVHKLQCVKCHEAGGSSKDDDAGILAGQWMHYLDEQFTDYASGKREMPKKMKAKMDKLSKEDIKALVQYYGSFQ